MCRCAERRAEIGLAVSSVLRGDISRISPAARFVVSTSAEDAAAAFRAMVASVRRVRR